MEYDLSKRSGSGIGWHTDDYHNVRDMIQDLESFVHQFSTHSMNEYALYLQGQKAAYEDVIAYLNRIVGDDV